MDQQRAVLPSRRVSLTRTQQQIFVDLDSLMAEIGVLAVEAKSYLAHGDPVLAQRSLRSARGLLPRLDQRLSFAVSQI